MCEHVFCSSFNNKILLEKRENKIQGKCGIVLQMSP